MSFDRFLAEFEAARANHQRFVVVTLVGSRGSAPQEPGARLIVTDQGYLSGTVGGGKLEAAAITAAVEMLAVEDSPPTKFHEWNLQTDIGMSCGGIANLFFERHQVEAKWKVAIFGAGHVSQELVRVLLRLECSITVIDSREEWLAKLPSALEFPRAARHLKTILRADMTTAVAELHPDSYVIAATMGHGTDQPILAEILKREGEFSYLGAIGSDVKAAKLRKGLLELGVSAARTERFFCPIGEPFGDNTPAEIAISIVSQMMRVRDSSRSFN